MSTLKDLETVLVNQPYIAGFTPSAEDSKTFEKLIGSENVNVIAWAARMSSYYAAERAAFPAAVKK